jgi:antigen flippase
LLVRSSISRGEEPTRQQSNPGDSGPKAGYNDVLRASSITGASAAITLLVGAVGIKFGAVFLGVGGLGQLRLYQSIVAFCSSVAIALGSPATVVQDLARANAIEDVGNVQSIIASLRRLSLVVGLTVWVVLAAVAWPLARWMFGEEEAAWRILVLGATVPLLTHGAAQIAVLRGYRRVGAIARINVICAASSTLVSVAAYATLGVEGIIPALIASAAISALIATVLVERQLGEKSEPRRACDWSKLRDYLLHGTSLTVGTLAGACVGLLIPALIGNYLGIGSTGLFAAAWGISGLFANFILGAMGTDYLPRLASVAGNPEHASRIVNEQTEVGLLLALPGLVATIVLAPYALIALYTEEFRAADGMLMWFTVGVLLKVASWPLAYAVLAHRLTRVYTYLECGFSALYVVGAAMAIRWIGLPGVALAFVSAYFLYTVVLLFVVAWYIKLRWHPDTCRIAAMSALLVGVAAGISHAEGWWRLMLGAMLMLVSLATSVRVLSHRLGDSHRAVAMVSRLPVLSMLVPRDSSGAPTRHR